MVKRQARLLILTACLGLLVEFAAGETKHRSLELVCRSESTLPSLSQKEVRKLFLGVPMVKNNVRLKPLRNDSDPMITEVFLQEIIFMSRRNYERQLVSRVFRLGGARPPVYTDFGELVEELNRTPGSLSYMWSDQVAQVEGIKSCGALW